MATLTAKPTDQHEMHMNLWPQSASLFFLNTLILQ